MNKNAFLHSLAKQCPIVKEQSDQGLHCLQFITYFMKHFFVVKNLFKV